MSVTAFDITRPLWGSGAPGLPPRASAKCGLVSLGEDRVSEDVRDAWCVGHEETPTIGGRQEGVQASKEVWSRCHLTDTRLTGRRRARMRFRQVPRIRSQ